VDTATGNTTASIQVDDTDAALTQDSTVAAVEEGMGNPTNHLDGEDGPAITVDDVDQDEPVVGDAVMPTTTNTANTVVLAEAVGGTVQVAAPTGEIAGGMANATNGDSNPPVQPVIVDATPDALTTNDGNSGVDQEHSDGRVVNGEADTPPPAVPTAEVAVDGQPADTVKKYAPTHDCR
jgi:hypothetical protein